MLLIKNGRVIDPANNIDGKFDILVKDGKIAEISPQISNDENCKIIDASEMWVTPGLVDMHVHLRDPGGLHKETIATGARAAAAGGFTTICCMPNTSPTIDNAEVVNYVTDKATKESPVNIIPIGSITRGLNGTELSDYSEMKTAGICAISDDGKTVENIELLKSAMLKTAVLGLTMLSHCEDLRIVKNGLIHEGEHSAKLGLPGNPAEAEVSIIARDISLAKETGVRLHICHVSTAEGVELIRAAQKDGFPITAEVCPHHFTLIDEDMTTPDANFKMSPPLRSRRDRAALLEGLKDGTISVIATDHAPHSEEEKSVEFAKTPNGIIGLETAVPLCISELTKLTPSEIIAALTINPSKILNLDAGHLTPGATADITIIDPNAGYTINKNIFKSKSRNTPFHGRQVTGCVVHTIVKGVQMHTSSHGRDGAEVDLIRCSEGALGQSPHSKGEIVC